MKKRVLSTLAASLIVVSSFSLPVKAHDAKFEEYYFMDEREYGEAYGYQYGAPYPFFGDYRPAGMGRSTFQSNLWTRYLYNFISPDGKSSVESIPVGVVGWEPYEQFGTLQYIDANRGGSGSEASRGSAIMPLPSPAFVQKIDQIRKMNGNPLYMSELLNQSGAFSYPDLTEDTLKTPKGKDWEDNFGNDFSQKDAFMSDDLGNLYLRLRAIAILTGAKVTKLTNPPERPGINPRIRYLGRTETHPCGNSTCTHEYYYNMLESDYSYYNQNLLNYEIEASKFPEIKKFYVDPQGNLHISAEAFGYSGGTEIKGDLILDYEKNKDRLPDELRDLDNPSNIQGGYWRKMAFPDQYEDLDLPFLHSLGDKDGLADTNNKLQSKGGGELVIPKERIMEIFKTQKQYDLYKKKVAYEKAGEGDKYDLYKYVAYGNDDPNSLAFESEPHTITLYVLDKFGRFDYLTIAYNPLTSHDGKYQPGLSWFHGSAQDPDLPSFSHQSKDNKNLDMTQDIGATYTLYLDTSIPDTIKTASGSLRPTLLAAWASDFPSMDFGQKFKLNLKPVDGKTYPHSVDLEYKLGNNRFKDGKPVSNTALELPQEKQVYTSFDPNNFDDPKKTVVQPNTSQKFTSFPHVLRSGMGIAFESRVDVRAIIDGASEDANIDKMVDLLHDMTSRTDAGKSLILSGKKDDELLGLQNFNYTDKDGITRQITYRNLNNNLSGEAAGGTPVAMEKTWGDMKVEVKTDQADKKAFIRSLIENSSPKTSTTILGKDAYGELTAKRTVFNFEVPLRLELSRGKYGGNNTNSKDQTFDGKNLRMYVPHVDSLDGLYTLRLQGTANVSKLNPKLKDSAGNPYELDLFSALQPFVIFGSIHDNFWNDTTNSGSGGGTKGPVPGTDNNKDEDWEWH